MMVGGGKNRQNPYGAYNQIFKKNKNKKEKSDFKARGAHFSSLVDKLSVFGIKIVSRQNKRYFLAHSVIFMVSGLKITRVCVCMYA